MRYQIQRVVAPELIEDLRQVAMERPRFGYRRLHVMLRQGLRLVEARGDPARAGAQPTKANESWAMGFVSAGTAGGRT